jgi:DnaJ-domain-containing protein 1
MSIPRRILRLLQSELNHRLGRFHQVGGARYRTRYQEAQQPQEPPSAEDARLKRYYARLELPYGASLDEVKQAYRSLMKRYHPDRFQTPEQREAATELVKALNEAYRELLKHLEA